MVTNNPLTPIRRRPLGCKRPTRTGQLPNGRLLRAMIEPRAPAVIDRSATTFPMNMYDNDKYGNCTAAAVANGMQASCALNGFHMDISTPDVDAFYAMCTGWSPTVPGSDQGADPTLVMRDLYTKGFTLNHGGRYSYTYNGTPWLIEAADRNSLGNTINVFGYVYGAFGLSESDSDAVENDIVWDTTNPGNQTPWSWGGHLMDIYDYTGLGDTDTVRLITWGEFRKATWRWVRSRMDTAYGVAYRSLLPERTRNQLGDDWDQIQSAAAAFAQKFGE